MGDKKVQKKGRLFTETWLGKIPPFGFLFGSIPSISDSPRRWATFQIILSFTFLFVAVGIAILTIDFTKVSGGIMMMALVFLLFGLIALGCASAIGIYWFRD